MPGNGNVKTIYTMSSNYEQTLSARPMNLQELPEKQFELIMKHVDKELSASESVQLNELVLTSEAFRHELMVAKSIVAGIKAYAKKERADSIRKVINELGADDKINLRD